MNQNYEIERKFLIKIPDVKNLDAAEKLDITQIYLNDGENGLQRRIRRIMHNNDVRFYYTEKNFITAVTRIENEKEISEQFLYRVQYHSKFKSRFRRPHPLFWGLVQNALKNKEKEQN